MRMKVISYHERSDTGVLRVILVKAQRCPDGVHRDVWMGTPLGGQMPYAATVMTVNADTKTTPLYSIEFIETMEPHRHKGYALELWLAAEAYYSRDLHAARQDDSNAAFLKAIGRYEHGEIPEP